MHKKGNIVVYFAKNIAIVLGIVLVWRGIWQLLDVVDFFWFEGNPLYTAIAGIVIGLVILYFPDKDLKELEKL